MMRTIWRAGVLALITTLGAMGAGGQGLKARPSTQSSTTTETAETQSSDSVTIEAPDNSDQEKKPTRKDRAYLGVSTVEISETMAAQLGLEKGMGLAVIYVDPGSSAARAGLRKHDVITEFADQSLNQPTQLRKLVQTRKAGDTVKLTYYRAGKQESASVTLGKAGRSSDEDRSVRAELEDANRALGSANAEIEKSLQDSLGNLQLDRKKLHDDIHRSMEEVRKSIHEALMGMTNVAADLEPVRKMLRELHRSGVHVDNNSTVTVRSAKNGVKSVVKADDSGTIVLVQNPKIHLTAHDKEGRLLFDGEIETSEQREKVPKDLWERVEPLMEKMGH